MTADNSGNFVNALNDCTSFAIGTDPSRTCLKNIFKQKLSYAKDCNVNNGTNLNICFPDNATIKFLNGTPADYSFTNNNLTAGLLLNDGASLAFGLSSATCSTVSEDGRGNNCGIILLDVNGLNGPNTWGKDIFLFFIFSNGIRPAIFADNHPYN